MLRSLLFPLVLLLAPLAAAAQTPEERSPPDTLPGPQTGGAQAGPHTPNVPTNPGPAEAPRTFEAYRAAFSAATLPPGAGAATVTGWTLHYRGAVPHAAFVIAVTPEGRLLRWRFVAARPSPEAARRDALSLCESQDRTNAPPGTTCRILATDLAPEGQPAVMAPRTEAIGPFRASPLHWRHGPTGAAGVVVWSHGYGGRDVDSRTTNALGFLSLLNDAGWDVYRFDRSPLEDDIATSLARLLREAPLLRAAGYRRVVLAGQSRGAWQSLLLAGAMPEAVDAVIAAAPAAHGNQGSDRATAVDDFRRALAGLADTRARLAVALFDDDPYDPDIALRTTLVEEAASRRGAPTLLLRPTAIRGHGGVTEIAFTQNFGACLLAFLVAPEVAAPRGLRRNGCGGG